MRTLGFFGRFIALAVVLMFGAVAAGPGTLPAAAASIVGGTNCDSSSTLVNTQCESQMGQSCTSSAPKCGDGTARLCRPNVGPLYCNVFGCVSTNKDALGINCTP